MSSVNYVFKLIEKVVANKIKGHVDRFGLENLFQSGYKAFHFTEIAVLSVKCYLSFGNVTALTMVELSAAFDTIDHGLLLDRLEEWFSILGDESYL